MSELEPGRVFEVLDPPPGGLTRLRARMGAERRRRFRNRSLAAGLASAAAVALVAVFLVPGDTPSRALPGLESELVAIRLGLAEAPTEVVSIRPDLRRDYAVRQVPTSDDRVVFYMVGSRQEREPREQGEAEAQGT